LTMTLGTLLVLLVLLFILIAIPVMLVYKASGEAELSVRDWVKIRFRGSNMPDTPTAPVERIVAPTLRLRLFRDSGAYAEEIAFAVGKRQSDFEDFHFRFGLVLENAAPDSPPASGIRIRLEVSCRGMHPRRPPAFRTDAYESMPGWSTERDLIQQVGAEPRPALLNFAGGHSDASAYGHPIAWPGFQGRVGAGLTGRFLLDYRVTTTSPATTSTGQLKIVLEQ
jgi:hypothetical protein